MNREELIQSIVENLAKCQRPAFNADWKQLGLSHAQASMLYLLFYRQPVSVKQIAEHLGISKSAVSQLLDPLADKELVERHQDPKDRRIVHIVLTARGGKLLKRLSKYKFAGLRSALETLSEDELKTLDKIQLKMALSVKRKETAND